MQRRKWRHEDRLFVLPSLAMLKYRDSEGLRGKLIIRQWALQLHKIEDSNKMQKSEDG